MDRQKTDISAPPPPSPASEGDPARDLLGPALREEDKVGHSTASMRKLRAKRRQSGYKAITFELPASVHGRLKVLAAIQGRSMGQFAPETVAAGVVALEDRRSDRLDALVRAMRKERSRRAAGRPPADTGAPRPVSRSDVLVAALEAGLAALESEYAQILKEEPHPRGNGDGAISLVPVTTLQDITPGEGGTWNPPDETSGLLWPNPEPLTAAAEPPPPEDLEGSGEGQKSGRKRQRPNRRASRS